MDTLRDGTSVSNWRGEAHRLAAKLVDPFRSEHSRERSDDGAELLALSELRTVVRARDARTGPPSPGSLTIATTVVQDASPASPGFPSTMQALIQTGGLNRWVYDGSRGTVSLEATLLVESADDDNLLRLARFILMSQVSEARSKLFSGLYDLVGGSPALAVRPDGSYLWESEDYTVPMFAEEVVLPHAGDTGLWSGIRDREARIFGVPTYGPYQGPGWIGFPTEDGWTVQLPWTSVGNDYGVMEILPSRFLRYSGGETAFAELSYTSSSTMWGTGLRVGARLPVTFEGDLVATANSLNYDLSVPRWTHGLGSFAGVDDGTIEFALFLPAYLATDAEFAGWLLDLALRTVAVTLQEVHVVIGNDDPLPHGALATGLSQAPAP